jgi:hypothetical protein
MHVNKDSFMYWIYTCILFEALLYPAPNKLVSYLAFQSFDFEVT